VCSKWKTTNCTGAQISDSKFKGNCKWIWATWKHVNSLDASLNNNSFIHSLCDLLTLANINNGANLQLPLDTLKQKGIQLQRGFAPDPPPGALPPGPPLGALPPDPRYRLAIQFELCAVLNWSFKKALLSAIKPKRITAVFWPVSLSCVEWIAVYNRGHLLQNYWQRIQWT